MTGGGKVSSSLHVRDKLWRYGLFGCTAYKASVPYVAYFDARDDRHLSRLMLVGLSVKELPERNVYYFGFDIGDMWYQKRGRNMAMRAPSALALPLGRTKPERDRGRAAAVRMSEDGSFCPVFMRCVSEVATAMAIDRYAPSPELRTTTNHSSSRFGYQVR